MSSALAVASVSFVLVDLLNNGLIDRDIAASTGEVLVTALSPDQIDAQSSGKSQLNLFLYNITQNEAWRNMNYPSVNAQGERINNPPLALNLHYLLTAYGVEQFHAEILLGYGMQLFHEVPVLPRDAIRKSLSAPSQVASGGTLPNAMLNLFTSDLADQVELIKIWPQMLTTEEISRLWTAFQAKYRPTAAYQVSVVLIESQQSTKKALPVRARTVQAIPFQKPVISQILSKASGSAPALDQPILDGYILVLQGTQLTGEETTVLFGDLEVAPLTAKATEVTIAVPDGLQAGSQSVAVNQPLLLGSPPVPHRGVQSDPVTFVLRPTIKSLLVTNATGSGSDPRSGDLEITLDLAVNSSQTVLLMLNQLLPLTSPPPTGVLAYSFPMPPMISLTSPPSTPPPATTMLTIPYSGVMAGAYLVRVLVDDGESLLTQGPDGRFNGPTVTIA
jgi:Pvc16 N-terminal domain